MLYETRNYLRREEAKTPLSVMLFQQSSVGVPGKISNSIAESFEFWKEENIYNVPAIKKKPYEALRFLLNGLHHTDLFGQTIYSQDMQIIWLKNKSDIQLYNKGTIFQ
jgi:hypothetical protein